MSLSPSACACLNASVSALSIPHLTFKKVYCASRICIQYSKITQIQSSIGGKGKEKHKVGSEMRLVKLADYETYPQATGAINFLYALWQSFQRWKYNSVAVR